MQEKTSTINNELRSISASCNGIYDITKRLTDVFDNNFMKFGSTDDLNSLALCVDIYKHLELILSAVKEIAKLQN